MEGEGLIALWEDIAGKLSYGRQGTQQGEASLKEVAPTTTISHKFSPSNPIIRWKPYLTVMHTSAAYLA